MGTAASKTIAFEEAEQWKAEGYSISRGLFAGQPLIDQCITFLDSYYAKYKGQWPADFGSPNNDLEFPSATILDQLVYHPSILNSVEMLLGTSDFILSQGDTWGKLNTSSNIASTPGGAAGPWFNSTNIENDSGDDKLNKSGDSRESGESGGEDGEGDAVAYLHNGDGENNDGNDKDDNGGGVRVDTVGGNNQDQRMHMDYGNHSFVHPPPWHSPEAVAIIIYLSDTSITGGGTAVVPKNNITDELGLYEYPYSKMPGIGEIPFFNSKSQAEPMMSKISNEMKEFRQALYENEIVGVFGVGDVLWYRFDTWHRGTPTMPDKTRYAMNLVFKKRSATHIHAWNGTMGLKLYSHTLLSTVINLTPQQRAQVLAVPRSGDTYWTENTIAAFEMRFPGIDVKPYEEAYNKRKEEEKKREEEEKEKE